MFAVDALVLGADSLLVGLAVAPALAGRARRLLLAAGCGVADGVASVMGAHLTVPASGWLTEVPVVLLAAYGVYLLGVSIVVRSGTTYAASGLVVAALPVALSFDNLVYPASSTGPALWMLGVTSGLLMLLGLTIGARLAAGLSAVRRQSWLGLGLLVAAGIVAIG